MKLTEPIVHLIGRPEIDWPAVQNYLKSIGASEQAWSALIDHTDTYTTTGSGQPLTEIAGRLCYRSWEPGLNPNVKKVRTDKAEYFENILKSGHGSVLEHATYNFIWENVSRVFTHEIVRHRVGVAISQESLRYVRLTDLPFWIPAWAQADKAFMRAAETLIEALEGFQLWMSMHFKLDMCERCGAHERHPTSHDVEKWPSIAHKFVSMPFEKKKAITSFMRRFAPEGLTTAMVWSANLRTIRHVIEMRTALAAEEEMRLIVPQLARHMQSEAPLLFADYTEQPDGSWSTPYRKV
jgi:thymidylate synthase (FAD)